MVGRGIVENSGGLVRSSLTLRMTPRSVDDGILRNLSRTSGSHCTYGLANSSASRNPFDAWSSVRLCFHSVSDQRQTYHLVKFTLA